MNKNLNSSTKEFVLVRKSDVSGVSGTGLVAIGVVFPSGRCVIEWSTIHHSINIYDDIRAVQQVHGHEGATEIVFVSKTCDIDTCYGRVLKNIKDIDELFRLDENKN